MEYLAAALLDLKLHQQEAISADFDPVAFEKQFTQELGLLPEIQPRYRTGYFNHIFSSGYSSWYNAYLYADILARDGFAPFEKHGLYDPQSARSLHDNVVSRGFTKPTDEMYFAYRGAEPTLDALMRLPWFCR